MTKKQYLTVMHEDIMEYTSIQKNKQINLYDLLFQVTVSLNFQLVQCLTVKKSKNIKYIASLFF